jgi:hypothetical protein
LAHHAANATARHLLAAWDKHAEYWIAKLKSIDADSAGADGPPQIIINRDQIAVDA